MIKKNEKSNTICEDSLGGIITKKEKSCYSHEIKKKVYVCQPHCITEQNAVTCLLPFNTGEMSWSSIFDSRF